MADTDILVSEMTPASQINTTDLMIMTQPDAQAETGYSTKSGTVLQVANKMLKGTEYSTDLPDFTDKTPLGGLEELKADIKALLPISSASGNPCNFETDIADTLVSLKAAIVASGGNGTPSTPIPIVGHSELNLVRCGKNLVSNKIENVNIESTGTIRTIANYNCFYCRVVAGVTYIITTVDANLVYAFFDTLPDIDVTSYDGTRTVTVITNNTVTAPITGYLVFRSNDVSFTQAQVELGNQATPYAPYNGTPYLVQFGQTVYGGEYDANAGKISNTNGHAKLKDLNWTANSVYPNVFNGTGLTDRKRNVLFANAAKCNNYEAHTSSDIADYNYGIAFGMGDDNTVIYVKDIRCSTVSDFTTTITTENAEICYELATPIEIDVSELSVDTIVGVNNIISDCGGDVEVQYRDSIQHYIDSKIASVQALIL